ncbi:MAG: peptidylprolyl isomerase, partial [Desulfurococcales archaeon ex4484_58]
VFSIREFQRRGIKVRVGEVIDFGGVQGIVKSVSGGRVVVDFNHPLAGKTLVYRVKVIAKLEDPVEKLKALSAKHLQIPGKELNIDYEPDAKRVVVTIPSKYITKRGIQYAKLSLATDILDFFKDSIDSIVFREIISRKREEKRGTGGETSKEEMVGGEP